MKKKECTNDEIINSQCSNGKVKSEQFSELNEQIEQKFKDEYVGEKETIKTDNVIFQMEKYDQQSEEKLISTLNLGKCEEALKNEYHIAKDKSLVIYKTDIKSDDYSTTYVQYKIYHPDTLAPLDYHKVCSKDTISISIPVNLNDNTKKVIESSNNSGYNIFDGNDSFYNDICTTYTSENGTDVSLNDRKNLIEESGGKVNYCQKGCKTKYYNNSNSKVKCDCEIQYTKSISNLTDISFSDDILLTLIDGLKFSNYLVLKCYKLLFDFESLKTNIGFILMSIIFISIIIIFFIYIAKGINKIDYYIKAVLSNKYIYIKNRKSIKFSAGNIQNINNINNLRLNNSNETIKKKKNSSIEQLISNKKHKLIH